MKTQLIDRFQRQIKYLRLSVTDRCDMRCFYCMPKGFNDFETPDHWLNFNEITQVIRCFAKLGVQSVRITGGEPLVRKNLAVLITKLNAIDEIRDLSLSTNALQLQKNAKILKQSGVSRINVSLDTLQPERFKKITNGPLDRVMDGLMAAKTAGFDPVKINMVVMNGVNDDEVVDMVEFCIEHNFILRFIETMPMGVTGQNAVNHYLDMKIVKQRLAQRYEMLPSVVAGAGPARYVKIAGTQTKIGFITPLSQHFCETCNRVRLSVDGTLYMCLGQDHSFALRPYLRQGISDDALSEIIKEAINLKPQKHEFNENPDQQVRIMSMTGG